MNIYNLVVKIQKIIEFEVKPWKHLFVGSFNETNKYQYLLLDHMMACKSKFLFKFPISNGHLLILDFSKVQIN
jgi:hypothetical protein